MRLLDFSFLNVSIPLTTMYLNRCTLHLRGHYPQFSIHAPKHPTPSSTVLLLALLILNLSTNASLICFDFFFLAEWSRDSVGSTILIHSHWWPYYFTLDGAENSLVFSNSLPDSEVSDSLDPISTHLLLQKSIPKVSNFQLFCMKSRFLKQQFPSLNSKSISSYSLLIYTRGSR